VACKRIFDPDCEQRGNTNVMVRRNLTTGDPNRVPLSRWKLVESGVPSLEF
jgi:hypothetical protein